MCRSWR